MADVTGPISTLPGSARTSPEGQTCDDHPDRPAYKRVQGETDSFGSEMYDMCEECYTKHREAMANLDTSGCCDWCKQHAERRFKRRDFEEGSHGRVYDVCGPCIDRQLAEIQEELDDRDDDYLYED